MDYSAYDLKDLSLPLVEGTALSLLAAFAGSPLTQGMILPYLRKNAGITDFGRRHWSESPVPKGFSAPRSQDGPRPGVTYETLAALNTHLTRDYERRSDTPWDTARRINAILSHDRRGLRAFTSWNRMDLDRQAEESTQRWITNQVIGPLDGVPVAVKDELDQAGFPTKVGTSFLGKTPAVKDAEAVARLRKAGALLVGKTTMHEIGLGTSGQNPHHGTPRNNLDMSRHAGGSSAGSGAIVGAGHIPLALGADGGGSIRIPAAFCGAFGLKATFGRISEAGAAPLCWSVAHVGPLGKTLEATALAYAVIAGPDPADPATLGQPPVVIPDLTGASLAGKKVGVDEAWFDHADPEVRQVCRKRLETMVSRGAELVRISIRDLEAYRVAHAVTILSEMALAMDPHWKDHKKDFTAEVRINLEVARSLSSLDVIRARQARNSALDQFQSILDQVDFIATPATANLPPKRRPSADRKGNWDVATLTKSMRYVTPANLTGLPALVFPAGQADSRLSVGFQLMGRAWDEAGLFEAARASIDLQPKMWS